jgi:hypothetical protein
LLGRDVHDRFSHPSWQSLRGAREVGHRGRGEWC